MLDKILQELALSYTMTDTIGVFLSMFDAKGELLSSQGTLQTTKPMDQLIPVLYNALTGSIDAKSIVVDVVTDIVEYTDKNKFSGLDMATSGVCIAGDGISGVLLPGTVGITSSKDALIALKKKYKVVGKIRLYAFTTNRIVIA